MKSEGNIEKALAEMEKQGFELEIIKKYPMIDVKSILDKCLSENIPLKVYGEEVDVTWFMQTVELLMAQKRDNLKEAQKRGIEKALVRKAAGYGTYGRPCAKVPEDFEKQVKKRIMNHESLSMYRQSIKMPSSTFYKIVKNCRNRWDNDNKT